MPKTIQTEITPYKALNLLDKNSAWEMNLIYGAEQLDVLATLCHVAAVKNHWWHDIDTGDPLDMNVGERIALMHSELSELMEAARKDLPAEHIEGFTGEEEEAADLLIRLFDYSVPAKLRLKEAFIAKFHYNQNRPDHKPEERAKEGGKKF